MRFETLFRVCLKRKALRQRVSGEIEIFGCVGFQPLQLFVLDQLLQPVLQSLQLLVVLGQVQVTGSIGLLASQGPIVIGTAVFVEVQHKLQVGAVQQPLLAAELFHVPFQLVQVNPDGCAFCVLPSQQ